MKYGIKDARTMEILVDNLTFDEVIEEFEIYQKFFGNNVLMTVCGCEQTPCTRMTIEQEYKNAHIRYFAELQQMGNLL